MQRIIDISMTIQEGMQVYKNKDEKRPKIYNTVNHQTGKVHESRIDIDVHCGTHVDAPLHMLAGGETIETIGLERLVGPARVLDLTHVEDAITKDDLVPHGIQRGERILFKTKNSLTDEFLWDFVYLREDGAQYLIERGVTLAGTDGLGIERAQPEYTTHRPLLRNNIVIVEGLRLAHVEPGSYWLVIAPLKLTGIDAAPARAFLIG
jgi:arylformamidase